MKTLGLDLGTTSISAVVYTPEAGVLAAQNVNSDAFLPSRSWERVQNPAVIEARAMALVQSLLTQHPDIQAIGVTGQMHGIVYLDGSGSCVSPLYTWQDGRGDLPYDDQTSWAAHLTRMTGFPLSTGYGMVTHFYNLKNGLIPENAVTFCTIADYLAMKLAGLSAPVMEPTNAASLGLFDLQNHRFDTEALRRAEIPAALLPPVTTAPALGVSPLGIPVFCAIGDNQAAFLGSVGGQRNALLINVGTGSQVAVYTPDYLNVPGLETRPFPDGGWLLVGASLCGGRSYAMLETFFRQAVKMITGSEQSAYAAMDRALTEAGQIDNAPIVSTTFQGTRQDPTLRGSISHIGIDNFTPVHLMHGMMNGMAQELYQMYERYLSSGGAAPDVIIGSGNGLRKNKHLCRAFETVFGCPMTLSPCKEEAACGAAMFAAQHTAV